MTRSEHMRYVGRMLKQTRLKLGLTQRAMAEKYGMVDQRRVSRWEVGDTYPNPWVLYRLCQDYKLSMDMLYGTSNCGK